MKKIFVSGAAGFIGSNLVEKLLSTGYEVTAFDKYNSYNHWGNLEYLKEKNISNFSFISGDIRDFDLVHSSIKGCDSVIHLAALIGIPYSYLTPIAYIRTNIEGTYNVLESSKRNKIKSIIVTSTSEVYGSSQYKPMDEKHPIVSQSPYSASKTGADNLSISYFKSFDLPVKIIRPFNTFGPRQSLRAIIPSIYEQAISSKKIKVGNLDAIRDFTYVDDLINAFIKLDDCDNLYGDTVNIGTGKCYSINEIIKKIESIVGKKFEIKIDKKRLRPDKSEVDELLCDYTKATKILQWKPNITFEEGLKKYYNWIKKQKKIFNNSSNYHV